MHWIVVFLIGIFFGGILGFVMSALILSGADAYQRQKILYLQAEIFRLKRREDEEAQMENNKR